MIGVIIVDDNVSDNCALLPLCIILNCIRSSSLFPLNSPRRFISPLLTVHHPISLIFTTDHLTFTSPTGCPRPVLTSKYSLEDLPERGDIEAVLELIRVSKPFPEAKLPGSVVRQREIVAELEEEFNMSAVNQVQSSVV
jgi:hypothetical protein